ncbi:MAG TPA: 50S ribosomal protein L4 [Actinomycetota bacterium]|nr:50S ribosomal protein L4 [Actinomycetota bacterium]
MAKATFFAAEGKKSELDLAPEIFDVQVNVPIMHEVVRSQLAAARSGTHSTKTRGEVRGGGAKPWMQKGTGRARHGSIREPSWVGGGIAHGPKPRDYSMRINKKERALALKSALSDRAREGKVVVIELPAFEEPETKRAVQLLEDWGASGKTLIVVSGEETEDVNLWKSFRNLPQVLAVTHPTAYTVLAAETVVFTKNALELLGKPDSKSKKEESQNAGLKGKAGKSVKAKPAAEAEAKPAKQEPTKAEVAVAEGADAKEGEPA